MSELTVEQAMQLALRHHQAGRLSQAEPFYRQILAREPRNAEALHLLGVIAAQVGRNDAAVELIGQAIAINPDFPEAHYNLGTALQLIGRIEPAIVSFRRAIALNPSYAQAFGNLANALQDKGQLDEAIAAYRQAIHIDPHFAQAWCNLGNAIRSRRQVDEALAAYRRAIAIDPTLPQAHDNLGNLLSARGDIVEAIAEHRQAIALKPNFPQAYSNLALALKEAGQFDEAIVACRAAIALKPDFAEAHCNMGNALKEKGQSEEAAAACRAAIGLKPDFSEAHYNLGNALLALDQFNEAINAYRRALELRPDYPDAWFNLGVSLENVAERDQAIEAYRAAILRRPAYAEAHWNLALALLTAGDFRQGWNEYEWRWKRKSVVPPHKYFTQPQWDGQPLAGATLLLLAEQGFGDTLQFIRYLPLVARRGGRIMILCQPELRRLLQPLFGDLPIIAPGEPMPAFEFHCPLLSLPRLFETSSESIPQEVPYLNADSALMEFWRQRMCGNSGLLKIGLVWSGSKAHKNDRNRSMALTALAPLAQLPEIRFYSLQKGSPADETMNPPVELELIDWTQDLGDFADSAALIANLDLVISVDTSVAHLAGAMGKPVWVMLPFVADWRWLLEREDSPWYPTMRLFRQTRPGDWESVVCRVAEALDKAKLDPGGTL